ncbi:hypothetical protein DX980_18445 [Burkholderia gladioli]|uniref:hypothetical protein n=1 Tax=Burkholderia gladioli TaxID=28095 RepID=UPI001364D5FE|nr:hypothetical protein [Burkholderia gladioli]KAF1064930.1 hypothetical protein LvStA_03601 [Burkholderia gladioli]WAG21049.1 hypothetical protein DX980_18445 [Burkholderia gladioli]
MIELSEDESLQIEEILQEWYAWQSSYVPKLGYERLDHSCRGFHDTNRFSTIDERAEIADRKALVQRCEQVDLCIDALPLTYRAAVQCHLSRKLFREMNRQASADVWSSARKFDLGASHAAYRQAKANLVEPFRKRGLMKDAVVT